MQVRLKGESPGRVLAQAAISSQAAVTDGTLFPPGWITIGGNPGHHPETPLGICREVPNSLSWTRTPYPGSVGRALQGDAEWRIGNRSVSRSIEPCSGRTPIRFISGKAA